MDLARPQTLSLETADPPVGVRRKIEGMDPITHGLLGATAAGACLGRRLRLAAFGIGAVAGMAPDLDVLIGYGHDHLNGMIYHRNFTHAIAFVPVGAAVVAGIFLLCSRRLRPVGGWVYLAAVIGMFTHGLLDCFTTYGTLWYWPFSWHRVAWDMVAIVDPVVTLSLLVGMVWAMRRVAQRIGPAAMVGREGQGRGFPGVAWPAWGALVFFALYMGYGYVQRQRAYAVQGVLAASRGQVIQRGRVMPTLGNLVVWRSLYQADGKLYADAVRLSWLPGEGSRVIEGSSVPVVTVKDLPQHGAQAAWLRYEFGRFAWFSDGYLARVPGNPAIIGDMRYSTVTQGFDPLWGMYVRPWGKARPGSIASGIGVVVHLKADRAEALGELWHDILGGEVGIPVRALGQAE